MHRRRFVITALLAAGAGVCFAQPRGRLPHVVLVMPERSALLGPQLDALRAGLRELGYVDGKNMRFDVRSADGDYERLTPMVAALVNENVDLLLTAGTPATHAAKAATSRIPIVMVAVGDPVGSGLVASLARPHGNITGTSNLSPELMKKRVELLLEAKPAVRKVAVLLNPSNPAQPLSFEAIKGVAESLKVEPLKFEARTFDQVHAAFQSMRKSGAEALVVANDTMLYVHRKFIAESAIRGGMPMAGDQSLVEAGGLIGYGSSQEIWRHSATYVDRILRGAKPADLPIEQPDKISLVVNLRTAKALGLSLPQPFRLRIDRAIE